MHAPLFSTLPRRRRFLCGGLAYCRALGLCRLLCCRRTVAGCALFRGTRGLFGQCLLPHRLLGGSALAGGLEGFLGTGRARRRHRLFGGCSCLVLRGFFLVALDAELRGATSTPSRRALDKPIAMACLVLFTPCAPSRTWSISSLTYSPAWVLADFPSRLSLAAARRVLVCGMALPLSWMATRCNKRSVNAQWARCSPGVEACLALFQSHAPAQ